MKMKKLKFRKLICTALALIMASVMAGCQSGSPANTEKFRPYWKYRQDFRLSQYFKFRQHA